MITARDVVKAYRVDELTPIVERGLKGKRDFDRGRQIFGQAGCASCHRFENDGGSVGPDLTNVAGRFSVKDLLESTLDPNKEISDQYGAIKIIKKDGKGGVEEVDNSSGG
jgi:putative heme-binding domain-containing protein